MFIYEKLLYAFIGEYGSGQFMFQFNNSFVPEMQKLIFMTATIITSLCLAFLTTVF